MKSRTELERAREHLRTCQAELAGARTCMVVGRPGIQDRMQHDRAIANVLAALSRVWDAQQREVAREGEDAFANMMRLRQKMQYGATPNEIRAELGLPAVAA